MNNKPLVFGLAAGAAFLSMAPVTHSGGYGLFSGHKKRVATKDRAKIKKQRKQNRRRK